ncbi:hypothetical protein ACPPVU_02325 [Mucilaginibacter sp. McL0603]|uniref:hypothetical protein n=1 Tax=Mucilaginibacter sp. McL0603 TaxID=3415670 RepID=UPI003CF06454
MKKRILSAAVPFILCFIALVFNCSTTVHAQGITVYQYRRVDPAKMDEFLKRETTYWSKVAQKAIDGGKMTFWAVLAKVGGADELNSPNVLFVNTFPDMDVDLSSVFDAAKVFPDVPMSKMDTYGMSTVISEYYLQAQGWQEVAKVNGDKDFKYIKMNYHNSTDPGSFNAIEIRNWGPFIKAAMDKNQTVQKAWGNAIVLSPTGGSMKFNCLSYDLYPTLQSALLEKWSPDTKFPTTGLDSLQKIAVGPPMTFIYQIVKTATKK